ncbi:SMEK domain-containing protein [Psychrobacter immobilis]|uniref:SMEK domain-containing protein n=1 Tax=Psychrobacter immobilis TaxID=498 RepID=UPI00191A23BE|nr:SMEK domain-containing protein [Psychrobacter immobilis]
MIIKREESIKSITEMLTRFVIDLSLLNGAGLYDINTTSEHFFIKILDITYNLSLKNLNVEKSNFPAIDLGDFNKKVCFQITSETSTDKLKTTILKFRKHQLNNDYDHLIFLIISHTKTGKPSDKDIKIEVKNFKALAKDISNLTDDEKIYEIESYLKRNVRYSNITENYSILPERKEVVATDIDVTNLIRDIDLRRDNQFKPYLIYDLSNISDLLNKLTYNQREVLFYIIANGSFSNENKFEDKNSIIIYWEELRQAIPGVYEITQVLSSKNLLHINHDYIPYGSYNSVIVVEPYFHGKLDLNIFAMLKDTFGSDESKLRDILINCNFSNL